MSTSWGTCADIAQHTHQGKPTLLRHSNRITSKKRMVRFGAIHVQSLGSLKWPYPLPSGFVVFVRNGIPAIGQRDSCGLHVVFRA